MTHPSPGSAQTGQYLRVVVAGVAGSGKTTIGARIAARLSVPHIDGDSFHSAANIAKMEAGLPLSDEDRWPWLDEISNELNRRTRVVISCSALKRAHRDKLRSAPHIKFVFLTVEPPEAIARMGARPNHFMSASMVESQFAALELPDASEPDVVIVKPHDTIDETVDATVAAIAQR